MSHSRNEFCAFRALSSGVSATTIAFFFVRSVPRLIFRRGIQVDRISRPVCGARYENSIKVSIHSRLLFREAQDRALSAPDLIAFYLPAARHTDHPRERRKTEITSRRIPNTVHSIKFRSLYFGRNARAPAFVPVNRKRAD